VSSLITIANVRGFIDENGTAQLNKEDISRGLGFVQIKNGTEYVRWSTVNGYLNDFGVSQLVEKEFIPENIFYRLAMKAQNQTAEEFQIKVADEILPAIRKTGTYSVKHPQELSRLEILELAIESEKKVIELQSQITMDKPKVLFAEAVSTSENSILIGEMAKIIRQKGVDIGQNRFFGWLREQGYLGKKFGDNYNLPTQKSMDLGLFEIKKTVIHRSSGQIHISRTPKVTGIGQIYFVNKLLNKQVAI
jgi:phage antirepressor YoqD-like protein